MPRYILQDNASGFLWGDTADFAAGRQTDLTPVDAARLLDASLGEYGRRYELLTYDPRTTETGYHVYRADVDGSEAVPVITDGQDQEQIAAVERDCAWVAFVLCIREHE